MTISKSLLISMTALISVAGLTACDTTSASLPKNDELLLNVTEQDGRSCIRQRDIRGFGVIDDDLLSVDINRNREFYLVTTIFQCQSLGVSPRVAFDGDFLEICGGGRHRVITGEESCPIKSVYKFDSQKAAFDAIDEIEAQREALIKEQEEAKKSST